MDPEAGPAMTSSIVSMVFYGWSIESLNLKLNKIKDQYDIPFTETQRFIAGRKFRLYDVERISRAFLNRGIIDYQRFYGANQIYVWMGRNHRLI